MFVLVIWDIEKKSTALLCHSVFDMKAQNSLKEKVVFWKMKFDYEVSFVYVPVWWAVQSRVLPFQL
jgi:hypothetical protein